VPAHLQPAEPQQHSGGANDKQRRHNPVKHARTLSPSEHSMNFRQVGELPRRRLYEIAMSGSVEGGQGQAQDSLKRQK
jgi:hypothetical protein